MTKRATKTPSSEQLQQVFSALVGNGLDFFVRSAGELDKEQKFAIAHFATGLELILKARLFHEHWTLIATKPHDCAWTSVKDGTVYTLQASDLCAAITTTTGTPLNRERTTFEAVFKHRNRVLHWAPRDDLTATVAEQCRAWYQLRELLTQTWADVFADFRSQVERVERLLREHRTHLQVRFEELEPTLAGPANAGLVVLCPSCDFRAGVAEPGQGRVHPFKCHVCEYSATALRTASGVLEHHECAEILDQLDPTPPLSPKEMSTYQPDRGYCGECFPFQETVARDGDDYVCVECCARFDLESSKSCEWCNERWFGWDSEWSYHSGCEHCDGRTLEND